MSEHTPGFYAIELQRAKTRLNQSRIVLAHANDEKLLNYGLLQLMKKYTSREADRKQIETANQSTLEKSEKALAEYNANLVDLLGANVRHNLCTDDKITAIENMAYQYIKMSRIKQLIFDIKSRFK